MKKILVRPHWSKENLAKKDQLAWKFAELASDQVAIDADVEEMVKCRIIDNASVALASLARTPVTHAREMALTHLKSDGALLFGLPEKIRVHCEWAAWANGTAVRELDFHDTFLAADYSHPGDNIPPLLAVAQQLGVSGKDFVRGVVCAYEVQVALVKAICLHQHAIDHIAHLGPSMAAGIGAMLGLDTETIYQSIQQALHVTVATRQSRKGEISSWKAYAPAHAGKLSIEAVDRCMRGEGAPSPIYEGEDSVISYILDGMEAKYEIELPESGEAKRGILETYTKAYSAEYQAQALIDLAFDLRQKISDFSEIDKIVIHTSHHTHKVIGTGANDPQKLDPKASRETLDHSIMYIFAVALEDGKWHHVDSYSPERANRPSTIDIWHKIETIEDPMWTKRYHATDPNEKAFGGRVEIFMKNGDVISDEAAVAHAHSFGKKPFIREDYINKFQTLTMGIISEEESKRFIEQAVAVSSLGNLNSLNVSAIEHETFSKITSNGIFK